MSRGAGDSSSWIRRNLLSRRALLRGAAGVAIGLPFLEAMSPRASADTFPKRFLVFFTANGTVEGNWLPMGNGNAFSLGSILQPLDSIKDKLLILSGFDNKVALESPGDGHQTGMGCMLTASKLNVGTLFCEGTCDTPKYVDWSSGISIDQYVAQKVGQATKFPSVEFGVQVEDASVWSRMSYLGDSQPVPPQDDPKKNFDRLFGSLSADPFGQKKQHDGRKSVLDFVDDDLTRLNARLGSADKKKLDAHLDAIRAIEKSLDKPGAVLGGSCAVPTYGDPGDIYKNANFPAVGKAQMDLIAMAIACDLTRVASLQWDTAVSNVQFSWLGITGQNSGHHDMSHFPDDDQTTQANLTKINTWYAEQFAYLCQKLDAVPEGNGTMLDNTVILWCNELGKGNAHTRSNMHWLLAGGAGGYFKTGRFLQFNGDSHSNLLVSIANAMGIQTNSFGDPAYCTGPMAGLTG
jgi:hypothetical protein